MFYISLDIMNTTKKYMECVRKKRKKRSLKSLTGKVSVGHRPNWIIPIRYVFPFARIPFARARLSTKFSCKSGPYCIWVSKPGEEILNVILPYNPGNGNKVIRDFNAKHPLWDSETRNSAGNVHFDFLTKSTSLSLLTPPTRFDPVMSRTLTRSVYWEQ